MTGRMDAVFACLASIVVVAAIAYGFVLAGSPATRRLERLDEQRVRDLQRIVREIQFLVLDRSKPGTMKAPLPATLADIAGRAEIEQISQVDPQSGQPYGYTIVNESTYELCADFSLPTARRYEVFWNHGAGRQCFTINVLDPPPGFLTYSRVEP